MNPLKVEGKAPWPLERIYKNSPRVRESGKKEEETGQADALELSPHALAFQQLVEEARKPAGEREKLVEEIRARLDAGTYQVPAERVAEKMLRGRNE